LAQNTMLKTAWDLIYLLSCAVGGDTPDPEVCGKMDMDEVFAMARSHNLVCAASAALEKITELPGEWRNAKGNQIRRQLIFDSERAKLLSAMEENGIWYLPLKGIILKDCYPRSYMREMSDNDILFDFGKAKQLRKVMLGLGYTCKEFFHTDHGHDIYTKPPMLNFEMHRSLIYRYPHRRLFEYYRDKTDLRKKDPDNSFGYHMSLEDFYDYLICHMFKHYSEGGTGLRALLDIYVFEKKYAGVLSREYIDAELEKMGLRDFEQQARLLAEKVFDRRELSETETRSLLYYIESGCYGTYFHRVEGKLEKNGGGKGKCRYILRRIFPSRDSLQLCHPFVYRHMILYPFVVIYRPIHGVFKKSGQIKAELHALKQYGKH